MTETLQRPASDVGTTLKPAPPTADVRFRHLTYGYPGAGLPALDDIDIEIDGGLTLVAGDSGSGKSSLLRALNGLVPHFHGGRIRGDAIVCGRSVVGTRTRELARHVGFVFQDPESQFVYGTVEREVAFGPENLGLTPSEIGRRVGEALATLSIAHLRKRAIVTLSGGERQRVALASALAMQPRILALDEPTSQLDPAGATAFLDAAIGLADSGASLVVAEHRLTRLLPTAHRMILVAAGAVVAEGDPRALAQRLSHPPQLVELARRLGWDNAPLTVAEARAVAPRLRRPQRTPDAVSGPIAWEVRGLSLRHGPDSVLEGVDLGGRAGEVVVLMGDNGSGKTTLLRALAGLQAAATGSLERAAGRVSYLPQDPTALLHRPTLAAEVDLTLSHSGLRGASAVAERQAVLGALGLAGLEQRYPRDLSGGERQRAAIAAILAGGPALALLDEPTRGMDGNARAALATLVRRMRDAGSAVVLATHDSELAADLGDRIVRLEGGRAVDGGPPNLALAAGRPGSTQLAELYPGGPVSIDEVMACL